jgi:hypothetical protein
MSSKDFICSGMLLDETTHLKIINLSFLVL